MQTPFKHLTHEAGFSALCRALAPAEVRLSYCASQPLPFRIELPSNDGYLVYRGATAEEAAQLALGQRAQRLGRSLIASAIEPSGEGAYVEAMRDWIEQVTPPSPRVRPQLRLVR